jgi:hypothetical protein
LWTKDNALVVEVLANDDQHYDYDVHRCRYAETYRDMGLGHIGHLLSRNRDGVFCQGYDDRISNGHRHSCKARRTAISVTHSKASSVGGTRPAASNSTQRKTGMDLWAVGSMRYGVYEQRRP